MDVYELLVIGRMLTHIVYDLGANAVVLVLMTKELVGQGIEQTIACNRHISEGHKPSCVLAVTYHHRGCQQRTSPKRTAVGIHPRLP